MQTRTFYNIDFALWLSEQVKALQQGQFQRLDVENLVEELSSLGVSEKRALGSQLARLFMHLLKWQYQPEKRSQSWEYSIVNARHEIDRILATSPSLRTYLPQTWAKEYERARKEAKADTGLPLATFPEECPYSLVEALTSDFLP
jgi:hypothetical protein